MKEIWKDVKNYEGLYELSNFGKVRTVERIVLRKSKLGKLTNFKINSKIKIANQLNSTTSIIQGITSGRTYKRKN